MLACAAPPARLEEPVNVVLIVVDTLRADHLPFYGYERDTAPNLGRLFADEGVVFESAYAQASWTPPSVASLLTGRDPRWIASADLRRWMIPKDMPTLAERLLANGYRTGGFQANLLLGHEFARGFETYFMTGRDWHSYLMSAREVLGPALEWLEKLGAEQKPFFLYVHFLDPHDPYLPPRAEGAPAMFDPGYRGAFTGEEIHGLNHGKVSLSEDPQSDLRHLTALYDEEIHFVDGAIGELVAKIEARPSSRPTLFVLTADHGEELQDHGGWTHGRTIYQEIVRVPLAFRLHGTVPGGRRLAAPVPLLDLAPTVAAAAKIAAPGLPGRDLLPVLLDPRRRPEPRAIHLRSWQRGPLRVGLVDGRWKTAVYNRGEQFQPQADLEAHLAKEDDRRLPRAVSFDLLRDPAERNPLPPRPGDVERILDRSLRTYAGARALLRDVEPGAMVSGRMRWGRRPQRVIPILLTAGDEVVRRGRWIHFRLRAEEIPKGFVVQGGGLSLERVELDEGGAGSTTELQIGGGVALPARAAQLALDAAPAWSGRRSLRVWRQRGVGVGSATMPDLDDDTMRRLKALGYL
jgi:arylsulfatase A-like enzyme